MSRTPFRGLRRAVVLGLLLWAAVAILSAKLPTTGFCEVTGFGSNPGNLRMYLYTPGLLPKGKRPLVVALHGCFGSAEQFRGTGIEAAGWRAKFHIIFAEQQVENSESRCFNHFKDKEPEKGEAEMHSIMQMIAFAKTLYPIDSQRVFAMGFSSGGQMAMVLGARFPSEFNAISAIGAGSFRCNEGSMGIPGFASCDGENVVLVPPSAGIASVPAKRVLQRKPRLSLWHGRLDQSVKFERVQQGIEQWANFLAIDTKPDRVRRWYRDVVHTTYTDKKRHSQIETVIFERGGHTVPVRPPYCGGKPDDYFAEERVCFAWQSARFFGLIR